MVPATIWIRAAAAIGMVAGVHSSGCGETSFACETSAQCSGGSCEATGYCSFEDGTCASGRRYGQRADPIYAGKCVDDQATAATSSSGGAVAADDAGTTTTAAGDDSSGPQGETAALSTGEADSTTAALGTTGLAESSSSGGSSESSSTTGAVEICDGIDNDGDGLIDEASESNDNCDGCALGELDDATYFVCGPLATWEEARAICQSKGAELASIPSQAHNDFVTSMSDTDISHWLGAVLQDEWEWLDGSLMSYENWHAGGPDGSPPGASCSRLTRVTPPYLAGEWDDVICDGNDKRFVCSAQLSDG